MSLRTRSVATASSAPASPQPPAPAPAPAPAASVTHRSTKPTLPVATPSPATKSVGAAAPSATVAVQPAIPPAARVAVPAPAPARPRRGLRVSHPVTPSRPPLAAPRTTPDAYPPEAPFVTSDAATALTQALRPDPLLVRHADAQPGGAEAEQRVLRTHALQIMNALRTLAPLVEAAHAAAPTPTEQSAQFSEWTLAAETFARTMLAEISDGSVEASAAPVFQRMLERVWVEMGGYRGCAPAAPLRAAWHAVAKTWAIEDPEVRAQGTPAEVVAAMTKSLALTDIVPAPSPPDGQASDQARAALFMDLVANGMGRLLPDLTPAPERARTAVLLLEAMPAAWSAAAGQVMATPRPAWPNLVQRFRDRMLRLMRLSETPRPRRRASA